VTLTADLTLNMTKIVSRWSSMLNS